MALFCWVEFCFLWQVHYAPIIGQEQVDYMLAEFQSEQAIEDQISGGYRNYLLVDGERSVVQFVIRY